MLYLICLDVSAICPFHWIHRACWRYVLKKDNRADFTPKFVMETVSSSTVDLSCM